MSLNPDYVLRFSYRRFFYILHLFEFRIVCNYRGPLWTQPQPLELYVLREAADVTMPLNVG